MFIQYDATSHKTFRLKKIKKYIPSACRPQAQTSRCLNSSKAAEIIILQGEQVLESDNESECNYL